MLILTRKSQQVITIGDGIRVVVLGIQGGQVRLGIEAPEGVQVDREEIRIKKDANPDYVKPEVEHHVGDRRTNEGSCAHPNWHPDICGCNKR